MGITIVLLTLTGIVVTFLTYMGAIKMHDIDDGWDSYIIQKNRFRSRKINNKLSLPFNIGWAKKTVRFRAIFGQGCSYKEKWNDGIHRLFGVSYGFDASFRSVYVGWQYDESLRAIQLFLCFCKEGNRFKKTLLKIRQFETVHFMIFHNNIDKIIVEARSDDGHRCTKTIVFDKKNMLFRWSLFPKFDKKNKAERDTIIFIKHY